MINASELRIGNWVINDEGEQCQVMEISFTENPTPKMYPHQEFGLRHPMMQNFLNIVQECEPIPLTPEVLEMCGFTDSVEGKWWHIEINKSVVMHVAENASLSEYVSVADHDVQAPCKHLHQLQNLFFALTATELNYNP